MKKSAGQSIPVKSTINHIKATNKTPTPAQPIAEAKSTMPSKPILSPPICYICKEAKHYIQECPSFAAMSPTKRSETVFTASRCLKCAVRLGTFFYTVRTCKKLIRCAVEGCTTPWNHISLLHGSTFKIKRGTTENTPTNTTESLPPRIIHKKNPQVTEQTTSFRITAQAETIVQKKLLFKVVPIRLRAGNQSVDTFAFLDSGSDTTLIGQDVAAKLDLNKTSTNLQITTYDGCKKSAIASIVDFDVVTDVVTEHLYNKVRILPSHLPGPAAFKTPFGWCLGGKMSPQAGRNEDASISRISMEQRINNLDAAVQQFWTKEQELKRREKILKSTIKRENNRYAVSLM